MASMKYLLEALLIFVAIGKLDVRISI